MHSWLKKIFARVAEHRPHLHLNKIASVTFQIKDSNKIAQTKTISEIGWIMNQWAMENAPRYIFADVPEKVSMDGGNTDEPLGAVNWYLQPGVDLEEVYMYIRQCVKEELIPLGIQVGAVKHEMSNMFNVPVMRANIIRNDTASFQKFPSMNLANRNAGILLNMLGLENLPAGQIDANDLLNRIARARPNINAYAVPKEIDKNYTTFGLDEDKINYYLDYLQKMSTEALRLNNPQIVWH